MIYFIEHAGLIKIGFATNIEKRLESFKTAIPAFVRLGSMEGSRGHERAIHNALAFYREKGEWFRDCTEVRNFLMQVIRDGIEEWRPARTAQFTPSMWDKRALRLVNIICAERPQSELRKIGKELSISIPAGVIWNIRYRQSREVSVGEYFALLAAAREAVKQRRAELDRADAFIADLEREDANNTNGFIDVERQFEQYRAAVFANKAEG